MFGKKIIISLFFITSLWASDQINKNDIKKMGSTFRKIENVGRIKNDCCSGNEEIKKSTSKVTLNVQKFAANLTSFPVTPPSHPLCAKGVRTSLNFLFGKSEGHGEDLTRKFGRPAKEFNEKIFQQWRTATSCFKNVQDNNKDFHDFDIRVIQPKNKTFAGHIEIYYKGIWYSDYKQSGTYWKTQYDEKTWKSETWESCKLYRLSPC